MVFQREVMADLHVAVTKQWRQGNLWEASQACKAAGHGKCGAGRSSLPLPPSDGLSRPQAPPPPPLFKGATLVASELELYYAFASCLHPGRVVDVGLSGTGKDFEPAAGDCSETEMATCRAKQVLLKACPAFSRGRVSKLGSTLPGEEAAPSGSILTPLTVGSCRRLPDPE